jgi:soluble lytic murein transglycosylase-like protein
MKPGDCLAIICRDVKEFDAALVMAVCQQESAFDEKAFRREPSGVCSYGLMQLLEQTARDRGMVGPVTQLYDPATNIRFGVAQLCWIKGFLTNRSRYGLDSLFAAYNEGVGNVLRGNTDIDYVQKVTAYRTAWQVQLGTGIA